jgi:Phosphoinositide phospholipase C, Ca2+-dependent
MGFRRRHFRRAASYIFASSIVLFGQTSGGPAASDPDASVRMNQIQVIGTHNSYHAGLLPGIGRLLQQNDPEGFRSLEYKHADLATQLDHGIRQIELDIFSDAAGGRFAHPSGPALAAQAGLPPDPNPYPGGLMLRPGFKVMHVQDIDYASNCQPFVVCLEIVQSWSRSHPLHVPIFILVETKQDVPDAKISWTQPEPYTPATFNALDAEIRSVFSSQEIITPDLVRGKYRTLEQAVLAGNWPTLAQARGKVIFLLDQQSNGPVYLRGHPGLRSRVLFTNATPGRPDAAFVEANDASQAEIEALVRKGYLVRTRSDADTIEGRSNDTRRRDEVLASGAQMVSTDYPGFEPARWTGYSVALPDGLPVRCNPIVAQPSCISEDLEAAPAH